MDRINLKSHPRALISPASPPSTIPQQTGITCGPTQPVACIFTGYKLRRVFRFLNGYISTYNIPLICLLAYRAKYLLSVPFRHILLTP